VIPTHLRAPCDGLRVRSRRTPEWKPQRAVFVADDDQGIWIVENPDAVANFPAAHVVLAGKFDSAKKTIHIEKITLASQ
jgi:hypothetical protein